MSAQIEKHTRLGEHDYDRVQDMLYYPLLHMSKKGAHEKMSTTNHINKHQHTSTPTHQCQHFKLLCGVSKKQETQVRFCLGNSSMYCTPYLQL